MGRFASRICGSSDLYHASGKGPECSINLVTCHDGFTLNDLVSYARKHNEANGEDNRDGLPENFSANYGVEGESDDPALQAVRRRQTRNFLLTLAISRGVPMLLAGDEIRRSQRGNNNAWCQNNTTSWVDWSLLERHPEIHRFTRGVFALRRAHPVLRREAFYTEQEVRWFDPQGRTPNWSDVRQKCLAFQLHDGDDPDLFLMFNADTVAITFILPRPSRGTWRIAVDTARAPPGDYHDPGEEEAIQDPHRYVVESRASVVLVAR
jgi:glycogen operon protein